MKINQPTATPTNKVAAAGIGGAIATIIIFVISLTGITIPAEVGAAIATVVAFVSGYYIKENK